MPKIHYDYFACPNEDCSARDGENPHVVQVAEGERKRCPCGQKLTDEHRVVPPAPKQWISRKVLLWIGAGAGAAMVLILVLSLIPRPPAIEIDESALAFDTTVLGTEQKSQITVRNVGKGKLTIHSVTAAPPVFSIEGKGLPVTIKRGGSAEIAVLFQPVEGEAAKGETVEGKLVVSSNDAKAGPQEVSLSGRVAMDGDEAFTTVFGDLDGSSKVLAPNP